MTASEGTVRHYREMPTPRPHRGVKPPIGSGRVRLALLTGNPAAAPMCEIPTKLVDCR
jgi:hypothetical protein